MCINCWAGNTEGMYKELQRIRRERDESNNLRERQAKNITSYQTENYSLRAELGTANNQLMIAQDKLRTAEKMAIPLRQELSIARRERENTFALLNQARADKAQFEDSVEIAEQFKEALKTFLDHFTN